MSKVKSKFVCQVCGYESVRWLGRCPNCQSWNSFIEIVEDKGKVDKRVNKEELEVYRLDQILNYEPVRLKTGLTGFDYIIGGGIVEGSVTLLAGEPGIGKSTLLLQLAISLSKESSRVLYISAEESLSQVGLRLKRLTSKDRLDIDFVSERDIENILPELEKFNYSLIIVDSIQTIYSSEFPTSPGNVVQVRECTSKLVDFAKKNNVAVILVGHVTKEGDIAGPKILEHLVDVVLYLEGERYHDLRVLRVVKNRFGPTNDFILYEMKESGLFEVEDISAKMIENRNINVAGSIIVPVMEGTKPLLIELQALVSKTNTSYPRRIASGVDFNKLVLLLAILEKKLRTNFTDKDVFVNVVGGIKINEPAVDLGLAFALLSALMDKPFPSDMIAVGEIGLGGEVRTVPHIERRLKEARKFGFIKALIPKDKKIKLNEYNMNILPVSDIEEGIKLVWGEEWRN
ncbi:MAG: DNA repair protein RadA [Dictyoglomus thermophilum]|uniref:DNA repair protein RadA n=1 Tax=Dictyoglomus thermophilum TaxID=14 RepID=A0A7V3ZIG3_DICTH|nr:DNA repair protein RadA [Dictyoglomus thermophilum]MCX7719895.1 DNA repair protein RadA [Dictyoglomus thermophilum]TYT22656.1 DNA repair protein RadA [Dictyoglomus thermophilum]